MLVKPCAPEESAFYVAQKGTCGDVPQMPFGCLPEFDNCTPADKLEGIRQWIAQRRAPALIALGRSRAASRARSILFSMSVAVVFAALSLSGCRNKKEEARQRAELTRALEQYKAQIGEHQKQAAALRARFDKLPEDMQGVGPLRDDLHAIEEVLGVEDGRTKWLSGKLDEAFASGKKEEIEAVRNAIPRVTTGQRRPSSS